MLNQEIKSSLSIHTALIYRADSSEENRKTPISRTNTKLNMNSALKLKTPTMNESSKRRSKL